MATPLPRNAARFTLDDIASVTAGTIASRGAIDEGAVVCGIATDTRRLSRGAAFVALRGARFDAHALLGDAHAAGAALAIVEDASVAPAGLAIVVVRSTLDALGALGRAHARRWRELGGERKIVAITGSAGKTTTRVALEALLAGVRPGAVHAASGNLNNRIGVPMVLLGLEPAHRFAVLELGTNQRGEIATLAAIAEPDAAILTLVAAAHSEGLGTIEDVAFEKGALFRALERDGVAVGNVDDPRVAREVERAAVRLNVGYGFGERAAYRIVGRDVVDFTTSRVAIARGTPPATIELTTPLLGEAGALATAAAVAMTEALLGVALDARTATEAFAAADVGAGAGRLVPKLVGDIAVLDDTYNANPASCAASIRAAAELARATGRRLVLVLGEMRELGAESAPGHDEVGRLAAESGAASILAVTGDAERIAARASERGARARFAPTVAEAARLALDIVRRGDLVLVKGSRGVETERVVAALAASPELARA